jgi:hypothetical protein
MPGHQSYRRTAPHVTQRTFLTRHDSVSKSVLFISRTLVRQGEMIREQARPALAVSREKRNESQDTPSKGSIHITSSRFTGWAAESPRSTNS